MKTRTKIFLSLAAVLLCAIFGGGTAEAGTYTVGNYTFTVIHCNAQKVCHDPSYQEAKDTLSYALAAHKSTYTKTLACGNTVTLTLKSCKVTNVCSNGNAVNLSAKCKRTTTTCACGCTSGICNSCPGDNPNGSSGGGCTGESCGNPTPSCSEDLWVEAGWSSCVNGVQNMLYTKVRECSNVDTPSPEATRTCAGAPLDGEPPACPFPEEDGSCLPPDIDFIANPKLISKGGSCLLRWDVKRAESCEIQGEVVDPNKGTKSVSPETTSVYKISCNNGPASASKVALCSVQDVSEQ